MKLFKKLLAVTLAGVLALSVLTACSGDGNTAVFDAMKKNSPTGYKVESYLAVNTTGISFVNGSQASPGTLAEKYAAAKTSGQITSVEAFVKNYYWQQSSGSDTNATLAINSINRSLKADSKENSLSIMQVSVIKKSGSSANQQAADLWKGMTTVSGSGTINTDKPVYLYVSDFVKVDGNDYRVALLFATSATHSATQQP